MSQILEKTKRTDFSIDTIIDRLCNDENFPMIPFNDNAEQQDKTLFSFFKNLDSRRIINELLKKKDCTIEDLNKVLTIIKSFKNEKYNNINFNDYEQFKLFLEKELLTEEAKISNYNKFKEELINDNFQEQSFYDFLEKTDFKKFIKYSVDNKKDIFVKVVKSGFSNIDYWLSLYPDPYYQFKKLEFNTTLPQDHRFLNLASKHSQKYFFEVIPNDPKVLKEMKRVYGLDKVLENTTKKNLPVEFLLELIETEDDFSKVYGKLQNLSDKEKALIFIREKFPTYFEIVLSQKN